MLVLAGRRHNSWHRCRERAQLLTLAGSRTEKVSAYVRLQSFNEAFVCFERSGWQCEGRVRVLTDNAKHSFLVSTVQDVVVAFMWCQFINMNRP